MDVSLDTCSIINLYKLNLENIIFDRFIKIYVYEFIRNEELFRHAPEILQKFDEDVRDGKIIIITKDYLKSIHMYKPFEEKVKDNQILYSINDKGEVYAISLALTLGAITLITDDIKERGPHYTLIRQPYCEIIPFACYELFLLDYLENKITYSELIDRLNKLNSILTKQMNMHTRIKKFNRRFFVEPVPKEHTWIRDFCEERNIDAQSKMSELLESLTATDFI